MKKTLSDDELLEMLDRPPEVFSGIMPKHRILYTNRLYLRRFARSDAPELQELMVKNRRFLSKWLQPQPEDLWLESVEDHIHEEHQFVKRGERLDLGVFEIATDKLVGKVALHSVFYGILWSSEVSYWVDEAHGKKGYITEAIATLISFAFEEAYLHRVKARIAVKNIGSNALAKKLGFVKEGVEREALFINGKWQDANLYAMLEKDYDEELADKWVENKWLGFSC